MTENKRTQKDRRADSDSRIIASAIKCFGSKGYNNTTMNEIAKMAGVTSGLLIHRFESKENLFTQVYYITVDRFFSNATEYIHFPDAFYFFIKRAKEFQKVYADEFKLLLIVSQGTDLPETFVTRWKNEFKDRQINKILLKAQEDGLIIKGDTFNLFNAFFAHLYGELDLCDRYNLDYPEDAFFMRLFNYSEDESTKRNYQFKAMLDAVVQTYDSLTLISLESNKAEQIKIQKGEPYVNSVDDAKKAIEEYIENRIDEAHKEEFRQYSDLNTLGERLKTKKIIVKRIQLNSGYEVVGSCIPVKRDKNGNVTDFLIGIQILGKTEE